VLLSGDTVPTDIPLSAFSNTVRTSRLRSSSLLQHNRQQKRQAQHESASEKHWDVLGDSQKQSSQQASPFAGNASTEGLQHSLLSGPGVIPRGGFGRPQLQQTGEAAQPILPNMDSLQHTSNDNARVPALQCIDAANSSLQCLRQTIDGGYMQGHAGSSTYQRTAYAGNTRSMGCIATTHQGCGDAEDPYAPGCSAHETAVSAFHRRSFPQLLV
jgi:hypothetical protein